MGPRGRGGASRHVTHFPRAADLAEAGRVTRGAWPAGRKEGLDERVGPQRAGAGQVAGARAPPQLPVRRRPCRCSRPGCLRGRLRGLGQWRAPTSGELLVTARHGRKRPFPFFSRFFLLPPRRPVGLNVRINSIARACTDPRRFPLYFKVPRKTSRPLGFSHFPKHKRPVSVAAAPPVRARPENPFGTDVGESRAFGKASRRG